MVTSVVIDNFDVLRAIGARDKANPPLGVDTYAVLSFTIAAERFQAIPGRRLEVHSRRRGIEHRRLALYDRENRGPDTGLALPKKRFSIRTFETCNHC